MKNQKKFSILRFLVVVAVFSFAAFGASAQEFKLALSSPPTSLDPQFYNVTSNINVSAHMFEALVKLDPDDKVIPGLAESWTQVNPVTWEFKLRKGVKFHNGSEFTAEDVVWSLDRPATIVGSPGSFSIYTKGIVKKIIDPHTIQLITKEPSPLLINDLAMIFMVSKTATHGIKSEDFASGKGAIGTGPFKFVKFLRDDRLELERNDNYWGTKPAWSKVTLRFIANDPTRLAALLAGDVDAIENVPTPDLARVRTDPKVSLFSKVSHRLVYLYLDAKRDNSPFVVAKDGKPLAKNPLKDIRVRQAMSMAIDRDAIREHVMEGLSEPASQLVSIHLFGFNPALKPVKADPAAAKKMLADAGYPNGFNLTLHTPNNRYINDEKITQAIAQMFSRIGIDTKVEALPMSVYAPRLTKMEFSMGLFGWAAQTGEASSPLRAMVGCKSAETGFGTSNRSAYCNPKLDEALIKALHTNGNAERLKLLQEATALAINDVAVIPIHHQVTTWAAKKGIAYTSRTDEATFAYAFQPK